MSQLPQGDPGLLDREDVQRLLASTEIARVAYTGRDDLPRVVPMMFHWDAKERAIVLIAFSIALKVKALRRRPDVAITIDTMGVQPEILSIRGPVELADVEGITPEYTAMNVRYLGEVGARARDTEIRKLGMRMVRITVRPTWVGMLDFRTRFPNGRLIEDFRTSHFAV